MNLLFSGIKRSPLAGGVALAMVTELLARLVPNEMGTVAHILGWAVALGLAFYAVQPWLRRHVLPYLPESWMADDVRDGWAAYLYSPDVTFYGDIDAIVKETRNGIYFQLNPFIQVTPHNIYGWTYVDFRDAELLVKQRGRGKLVFRYGGEGHSRRVGRPETHTFPLMRFIRDADHRDLDESSNYSIQIVNITIEMQGPSGRIIMSKKASEVKTKAQLNQGQ